MTMNMTTTTATQQFIDDTTLYMYKEYLQYYVPDFMTKFEYTPWIFSLLGATLIGLSGILPLVIIPTVTESSSSSTAAGSAKISDSNHHDGESEKNGFQDPAESKSLKILLSFAVGGLLGDVFLHLLPEAWSTNGESLNHNGHPSLRCGLWVLSGILIFTIVEKIFSGYANADEDNPQPRCVEIANCLLRKNGGKLIDGQKSIGCTANGSCDIEDVPNGCYLREREKKIKDNPKMVAGYLNLLANSIDNFTHGLAVAGSFLVSFRHGVLATFAILLHEIPHEVGDFAILLRSGFNRWDAARAQLLTATAGLIGALVAIGGTGVTSELEAKTSWIMPFTAGGFLHIAMVTVLPDLLKENDPKESIKQFLSLIIGIILMAVMTVLFES